MATMTTDMEGVPHVVQKLEDPQGLKDTVLGNHRVAFSAQAIVDNQLLRKTAETLCVGNAIMTIL